MKKLIYSKEDLDLILSLEMEEKDNEIEHLKAKIKELEQDRDENYVLKQNDPYSEYGISEKDFH